MCGIGGFIGQRPVERVRQEAMLAALRQRGPDACGSVFWGPGFGPATDQPTMGLLHARLSIRDPRPEADQPMPNATGDMWICFNGEVYGYEEDRVALQKKGYQFRTTSDTEFILYAYEAWGDECVTRLRGMFAFVILDLRKGRLVAFRDRLGLKPLLYYWDGQNFAFASTLRALLAYCPTPPAIDPLALDAYLAHRYIPAPMTLVRNIQRLPNGHCLTWEWGQASPSIRTYWTPTAHAADFQATLDRSVALRTIADRPVGIFLSGGVDSTVVASSLVRQGFTNLTAFTATFPGTSYDEGPQSVRLAKALGLAHRCIPIEPRLADDFDQIIHDLDEPFADPSALPLWYLARAASAEVKVVLGGDGGDELFAGYKRYAQHLRSAWRKNRTISLKPKGPPWGRASRWREELGLPWTTAYSLRFSGMSLLLRRYLQPALTVHPVYWRDFPPHTSGLHALLDIDFANYLPEYILRKGDLCTMAHGLELRAPLLDHRFVEAVWALSDRQRFGTPAKRLLGETSSVCQEAALLTAKKRGFSPPIGRWMTFDLAPRLAGMGQRLADQTQGQLASVSVDALVTAFRAGSEKLAEPLYQLLVLDGALTALRRSWPASD